MDKFWKKPAFAGVGLVCAVVALVGMGAAEAKPAPKPTFSQTAAFDRLKRLDGRWTGSAIVGPGTLPQVTHEFRTTSGGYAVTETLFAGTDMEMLSVFHMSGDDLVLTHYCSFGTQSNMKLDVENSTPDELRFVFVGGHNIPDPQKDRHIHNIRLRFNGTGRIESEILAHVGGKPAEIARSSLSRTPSGK
ncbi:hypothetical protein [Haliangium sp.]|uniref:hypothetical protein n=1 Tax=Haliangium sp. TaxID=2663208 RepID=UPI003D09F868